MAPDISYGALLKHTRNVCLNTPTRSAGHESCQMDNKKDEIIDVYGRNWHTVFASLSSSMQSLTLLFEPQHGNLIIATYKLI